LSAHSERLETLGNQYAGVELTSAQKQLKRKMVTWYSTHCGARSARYIKGQKYTLLSRKKNLTLDGKKALKTFGGELVTDTPLDLRRVMNQLVLSL
jgi:hypothetical protein